MLTYIKSLNNKIVIAALISGVVLIYYSENQPLTWNHNFMKNKVKDEKLFDLVSKAIYRKEYSGKKFRSYSNERRRFHQAKISRRQNKFQPLKLKCNSTKWGVVTTIFKPSEAVRRFLYRKDWCVVIVGDENKPKVKCSS